MSRKSVRLTAEHWSKAAETNDELGPVLRLALHWMLDPVALDRIPPGDELPALLSWIAHVEREWGTSGRACVIDDQLVGFAIYGPPRYFGGAAGLPTSPVSPDAVLLAGIFVDPDWRHQGLGRILLQGVAADLAKRKQSVLEAFGDSRRRDSDPRTSRPPTFGASDHVMPTAFATAVGFKIHRDHPVFPRLRMELRTALSWLSAAERSFARLVPSLAPQPKKATRMGRLLKSLPGSGGMPEGLRRGRRAP